MTPIDKIKNLTQEQFEVLYRALPEDKKWVLLWSSVALILAKQLNSTDAYLMVESLLAANATGDFPPARVALEVVFGAQGNRVDLEKLHNCETCPDKHKHSQKSNSLIDLESQKNAMRAASNLLSDLGLTRKIIN